MFIYINVELVQNNITVYIIYNLKQSPKMIDQWQITRELVTPQYVPTSKHPKTKIPKLYQFPLNKPNPIYYQDVFRVRGSLPNISPMF